MNRSQSFLLLCIALSALVSLYVISPFLEYVFGAVILAYILTPVHRRLVPYLGEVLSPLTLIVCSLVVIILPVVYIVTALVADLRQFAQGETELDIVEIETAVFESTGVQIDLAEQLQILGENLLDVFFGSVTGIATVGLKLSLGLALVLFLVYYILKDGDAFVAWLRELVPLPPSATDRLFHKVDRTTWGVVVGHITVSIMQAVVAGAGLWAVGLPNVVFWTFVMAILALLPLIGAFIVWGSAAVYLAIIGDVTASVLLTLYGIFVVSLIDNYARPILIDHQARLNPGIILVGVFGGVYTIGFTGLFVGPIVLGILATTLTTFSQEYDLL
ncbi:AI-2E family transporter [Haloferacaceae archaeon DSL9]